MLFIDNILSFARRGGGLGVGSVYEWVRKAVSVYSWIATILAIRIGFNVAVGSWNQHNIFVTIERNDFVRSVHVREEVPANPREAVAVAIAIRSHATRAISDACKPPLERICAEWALSCGSWVNPGEPIENAEIANGPVKSPV